MRTISKGAQLLENIVEKCSAAEVAEAIGVSLTTINNLRADRFKPNLETAVKIERIYKIAASAWMDEVDEAK